MHVSACNAPPLLCGLYVLHTKTLGPRALQHSIRASESHSIPPKAPVTLKNPIQPQESHKTLVLGLGVSGWGHLLFPQIP